MSRSKEGDAPLDHYGSQYGNSEIAVLAAERRLSRFLFLAEKG